MKHVILIYIVLLFYNPIFSQKGKIERADKEFQKENYVFALELYKEYLKSRDSLPSPSSSYYYLAYSAMKGGEFELAYNAFQNLKDDLGIGSFYNYDYAQCLIALGKYEEAKEQIKIYLNNQKYYYTRYVNFVDAIANQTDTNIILKVDKKKTVISDKKLTRPAFFYQNGLAIYEDLFYDFNSISEKHLLFEAQFNRRFDFSPHQFTSSQKKTIISSYLIIGNAFGKIDPNLRSKLYECEPKNDTYEVTKGLPINSDEYDVANPSLNATGDTLYFSSNMPGGFGGYDLYYITYDLHSQSWEVPFNLGPGINTEYDEKHPFYHQNSYKLYFSSDGHPTYGMADIYVVNQPIVGEEAEFPINLGKNINSSQDDFGLILNDSGDLGFMLSRVKHNVHLYELRIQK